MTNQQKGRNNKNNNIRKAHSVLFWVTTACSIVGVCIRFEGNCLLCYLCLPQGRSQFLRHTDYILDCNEVKSESPHSNFRAVNISDLTYSYNRGLPWQQQTKHTSMWFGLRITYIVFRGHVSAL
jgi:hypothetical protein